MTSLCSVHNWLVSFASLTLVLLCNQKSSPLAHLATMESRDDVITRREYEAYYTEKFKKRLLHRLHMTEPPRFNTSFNARQIWSSIPHYVQKIIERDSNRKQNPEIEEKIRELIIVAKPTLRCPFNEASGCFILDFMDDISRHQLKKVTLSAESQNLGIRGKSLSLWEAYHTGNGDLTLAGNSPIHQIVTSNDNASSTIPIEFDLTSKFSNWLRIKSRSIIHKKIARTIVIRCDNCDFRDASPVDVHKVILEVAYRHLSRHRRNIENQCTGLKYLCCTEKFRVNVSVIGWDKWIISPSSFEVNYCRGRCVASNYGNTHAEVLNIVSNLPTNTTGLSVQQRRQIIPCCSARLFGTQSIFFQGDKQNVVMKELPNFNVIKCGCM